MIILLALPCISPLSRPPAPLSNLSQWSKRKKPSPGSYPAQWWCVPLPVPLQPSQYRSIARHLGEQMRGRRGGTPLVPRYPNDKSKNRPFGQNKRRACRWKGRAADILMGDRSKTGKGASTRRDPRRGKRKDRRTHLLFVSSFIQLVVYRFQGFGNSNLSRQECVGHALVPRASASVSLI